MQPPGVLRAFYICLLVVGACMLCCGHGFPVCAPGLLSCGTAGCYSGILTRCVRGQCQGILGSLLSGSTATSRCPVNYLNTCGNTYCGVDEGCLKGVCMPVTSGNCSQPLTNTLAEAAGVTADMSALDSCRAARRALEACAQDTTQLVVIDCNSIGIGTVPGVMCLQSRLFNCAAGPGYSPYYNCRGLAVLGDAISQAVGDKVENASQPILQPVYEKMANWVGNVSQNVLNITLPTAQGTSDAITSLATMLSGGRTNISSAADDFTLVPPGGINTADQTSLSMVALVSELLIELQGSNPS